VYSAVLHCSREWRTRQLLKMAAQEEQLAVVNKAKKDEDKKSKEQVRQRSRWSPFLIPCVPLSKTEQEWEQNRDKRVSGWRDFMKGNTKVYPAVRCLSRC
jgi:hypothetical protein